RSLGNVRLAAVGPATAARITRSHLEVDAIPDSYQAEEILGAIQKHESLDNLRILLARAEVANPQLPKLLEDHGAIVDDVATYQTVAASSASTQESESLLHSGADWITFASGSSVRHFHERFDIADLMETYPEMKLASIGPETTRWLKELELDPTVEAK
ncbi:MAG TPA: HemD protein, partial [Verrucomicrobiales bacterium]|nr:HemD protein [Verrucomicrobiales bacterium]